MIAKDFQSNLEDAAIAIAALANRFNYEYETVIANKCKSTIYADFDVVRFILLHKNNVWSIVVLESVNEYPTLRDKEFQKVLEALFERIKKYDKIADSNIRDNVSRSSVEDSDVPLNSKGKPVTDSPAHFTNFKHWFGKSVVKDTKGRPLVVYHGGTAEFERFDYNFIGNHGTSEGRGFYFTNKEAVGKAYADVKLYSVYLRIEKPLSFQKVTISRSLLGKFIKAYDPTGEDLLSNYGDVSYDGYNSVLRECLNLTYEYDNNDVDMVSGLMNACGDSTGEGLKNFLTMFHKVTGYDGILLKKADWGKQTIFITFSPGQIKAVENSGEFSLTTDNIYK